MRSIAHNQGTRKFIILQKTALDEDMKMHSFLIFKKNFFLSHSFRYVNRAFLHDVTAAMLVFQNEEMAAMMVYQTNPPGIELYFYANSFFCFSNPIWLLVT